jgi:long-chain acyl-CoA synthetase
MKDGQPMRDDTLIGIFMTQAAKQGPKVALKVKRDGAYQDITWQAYAEAVRHLALGLLNFGIQPGDRVALLSENRPEWAYSDFAILGLGAINVPIYATNTPEQIEYILNDSGSKILLVSQAEQLEKIMTIRTAIPGVGHIIVFDPPSAETSLLDERIISLAAVMAMGAKSAREEELRVRIEAVREEAVATLIYTSGTTGNPKGVILTHRNLVSNVKSVAALITLDADDILLSFLPLSHSLERMAGHYIPLYFGLTVAYAESVKKLLENLQEIRPTVLVSVPRPYEKIYETILRTIEHASPLKKAISQLALRVGSQVSHCLITKKPIPLGLKIQYAIYKKLIFNKMAALFGGRIRICISGGAPLAKEIAEFFHAAGILICEGYGLTETSPVLTCNTPAHVRFGTVGQVVPNVEVKIAADGEILARGPNVMSGYYHRPEDTREVLSEDGWFATGDIGEFDADNYLRITGRKKDIIVTSGGKNIAPRNLEAELLMDPAIEQAVIIGDKRHYLTALIVPNFEELERWAKAEGIIYHSHADLVLQPKVIAHIEAVVAKLSAHHPSYEQLKKIRLLPRTFSQETGELTPTLKVKRRFIMETYANLIEDMYES